MSLASATDSIQLPVGGMTCQGCAGTVERALSAVPGVRKASVNIGTRTALIERDPGADPSSTFGAELAIAVRAAGFTVPDAPNASLVADLAFAEEAELQQAARTRRDFGTALVLGVATAAALRTSLPAVLPIGLAAAALATGGRQVLQTGLHALVRRAPEMNTLVALGTLTAWLSAALSPLFPDVLRQGLHPLQGAMMILVFVLLGRWLESRTRIRAGDAVRGLLDLAPQVATLVTAEGDAEVPVATLQPGDHIRIRPGEAVPADGVVLDGQSELDESLLTGESIPTPRAKGERLHAGTLNGSGGLRVEVTGVGADSAVGRIAAAVHRARGSRAPIQGLTDRISSVFVPIVLALSATTLIGWVIAGSSLSSALGHAIAVLIVACPCALGLATPTAIAAAVDRAARDGILIREARALEELALIDTVVLDKTGTLTTGQPELTSVHLLPGAAIDADRLLALAAAAERDSEQPFGRAIVRAALTRKLSLSDARDFLALPGRGVQATVDGKSVRVESPASFSDSGSPNAALDNAVSTLAQEGATPVVVSVQSSAVGVLGLRDTIRPEAPDALRSIRQLDLEIICLSGDHAGPVRAVARALKIEDFRAEMAPMEKAQEIERRQAAGSRVAMVGDGINDSPALAHTNIGVAMGGGADVSLEVADAALLQDDLRCLPHLIRLSRRTRSTIRTNLAWAFAYNVLMMPFAAGILTPFGVTLSPGAAGASMAASSLIVVLNSLRLRTANFGTR